MTEKEAFEAWFAEKADTGYVQRVKSIASWAWQAAIAHERSKAPECARCESLSRSVMMDQTAHDMNLVAEKYAHKLALDLECVLSDYSGKWWSAAIETIGKYREEMNAIHERESPTFMGELQL